MQRIMWSAVFLFITSLHSAERRRPPAEQQQPKEVRLTCRNKGSGDRTCIQHFLALTRACRAAAARETRLTCRAQVCTGVCVWRFPARHSMREREPNLPRPISYPDFEHRVYHAQAACACATQQRHRGASVPAEAAGKEVRSAGGGRTWGCRRFVKILQIWAYGLNVGFRVWGEYTSVDVAFEGTCPWAVYEPWVGLV